MRNHLVDLCIIGDIMKLFSQSQIEEINKVAEKTKQTLETPKSTISNSKMNSRLAEMSADVQEYFKDSDSVLITSKAQLHEYIDHIIEYGYCSLDTETTGLDRVRDTIVGSSLYVPGQPECYIPNKHKVPIFDEPYKDQLTYSECHDEFQRMVDAGVKMIYANADFDLSMIYKDYRVDLSKNCYYDVILVWRCLKEDELHNGLKALYNKYVLKGKGDPRRFSDFFSPELFPYCKPEIAKLYAAHDAKITWELFRWQLPYVTKSSKKCQNHQFEAISDLVWNVELPLIPICQQMHRTGIYLDKSVANTLVKRYSDKFNHEREILSDLVDKEIEKADYSTAAKRPFRTGRDFNPSSTTHARYLIYTMMQIPQGKSSGTGKDVLAELNLPVTNQMLKLRSLSTLISTFVEKLPKATTSDSRIHARFNQIGAATGRMSSADPNMQNIPSHVTDIRHMFRATAQTEDFVDCVVDEPNILKVEMFRWDKVHTPNGLKVVDDLQPGDNITVKHDNEECFKMISSVSDSTSDPSIRSMIISLES